MRLENKMALITGGYGGMGRVSARRFAREGATVFIAGRKRDRGASLASEIKDAGGAAHFVELDIVNQNQLGRCHRPDQGDRRGPARADEHRRQQRPRQVPRH